MTTKIHELILVVSEYDELCDHLLYTLEALRAYRTAAELSIGSPKFSDFDQRYHE